MGRLRVNSSTTKKYSDENFNSNMGRLRDMIVGKYNVGMLHFNSNMGRLRVQTVIALALRVIISIPIWGD